MPLTEDEVSIREANAARFHPSHSEETKRGAPWTVTDSTADALSRLVVGRRIVSIIRESASGGDWAQGENSVTILLDNGAKLYFMGWGYDASGLDTSYSPPVTAQPPADSPGPVITKIQPGK